MTTSMPLTGSRKQIAWALEIRENALKQLWESGFHGTWERYEEDIAKLSTNSEWWIDNRDGISTAINERLGFTYSTCAGADY